jgi:hypothetical protein
VTDPQTSAALAHAEARLARSRRHLHEALFGDLPRGLAEEEAARPTSRRAATASGLPSLPAMVLEAGNLALAPTAERHPWWLVLGAAAAGAALAASRPWRWAPQVVIASGVLKPWLQPAIVSGALRLALARLVAAKPPFAHPASDRPPRP